MKYLLIALAFCGTAVGLILYILGPVDVALRAVVLMFFSVWALVELLSHGDPQPSEREIA